MGKLAKRMSLSGSPTSTGKRKSRADSDDALRSHREPDLGGGGAPTVVVVIHLLL